MDSTLPNVGDQLRSVRDRLGLRQEQLARIAQVSLNTYKSWEGGVEPPPKRLRQLIIATGLDANYLLGVPGAEMWGPVVRDARRRLREELAISAAGTSVVERTRTVLQWLVAQPWCSRELLAGIVQIRIDELDAILEGTAVAAGEINAGIGRLTQFTGIPPVWWVTGAPADLTVGPEVVERWLPVIGRFEALGVPPETVDALVKALSKPS